MSDHSADRYAQRIRSAAPANPQPNAEKDAALRLAENVRAVLRLISPEHITPMGKRQIERVLDEHTSPLPPESGDANG